MTSESACRASLLTHTKVFSRVLILTAAGLGTAWPCVTFAQEAATVSPPAAQAADAQPRDTTASSPVKTDRPPLLAGPQPASQPPSEKRFSGLNRNLNEFIFALEKLELSDEQKDQIRAIIVNDRAARSLWRRDNQEQIVLLREQIQKATNEGNTEAARQGNEKLKALNATMPQVQIRQEVTKLLSPGQQKELAEIIRQRREYIRQQKAAAQSRPAPKKSADNARQAPSEKKPAPAKPALDL